MTPKKSFLRLVDEEVDKLAISLAKGHRDCLQQGGKLLVSLCLAEVQVRADKLCQEQDEGSEVT